MWVFILQSVLLFRSCCFLVCVFWQMCVLEHAPLLYTVYINSFMEGENNITFSFMFSCFFSSYISVIFCLVWWFQLHPLAFFFPFLQSLKSCSNLHGFEGTMDMWRGVSHHYWSAWTPYLTRNWTMLDDPHRFRGCRMFRMLVLTLLNVSGNSCTPQVEMKAVVNLSKKKKKSLT